MTRGLQTPSRPLRAPPRAGRDGRPTDPRGRQGLGSLSEQIETQTRKTFGEAEG